MTAGTDIAQRRMADTDRVRSDFPILATRVNGQPLVYFDNAASSQKPLHVIRALEHYYSAEHSNIHRGVHYLSARATEAYENVRAKVQRFIHARHAHEVIFTAGTTESVNLVAATYGRKHLGRGDDVVITAMEHHSNIVPWQMACEEKEAGLKVVPVSDTGEVALDDFEKLITERTKIVALCHVSNTLGTVNPVKDIIRLAHGRGVPVLLDGAQAAPHLKIDVQELDCDFYAFSSHKMYGPTGVGVLYGKEKLLDDMPPYQGGGEMIKSVTFEKTTYNDLPFKFEAGTPNIADGIAFGAAIDYLNELGTEAVAARENGLLRYTTEKLTAIDGLRIIGTAKQKTAVVSFLVGEIHPYDTGTILDQLGIAVRTGHHCTEPLMKRFGIPGTVRASLAFYNTKEEVDKLVEGIGKVKEMFG